MGNCLSPLRTSKNVDSVFTEESPAVVGAETDEVELEPTVPVASREFEPTREEVVRCINEELAEFREQLKKSQELFHALSNSAQNVNVTQSCPVLADTDIVKSQLVDCSTQTDPTVIREAQDSFHLSDCNDDMDNDTDGQYLDKLSDDISYRLTINLPTVLEESEQETETSPAAVPKRMSSEKGNRPKLVRMKNATEEDLQKEGDDDAFTSDNDYRSAPSSMYNSLERPLQVSGPRAGDLDNVSIVSDGNTTYGSPLSSPSSPTYWTPSQGSSSQETITNHDGDKTPVNEEDAYERDDIISCPMRSSSPDSSDGVRQLRSTWGPVLPIDSGQGTGSMGVLPEFQKHHMVQYAFETPRISSEKVADILNRTEWCTLGTDLERQTQVNFTQNYAQKEGHNVDGGMEGEPKKAQNFVDQGDEAEEYCEIFPDLVEQLFKNLDNLKGREVE